MMRQTMIEQSTATWTTPYMFNAKELDESTGLYYYGARYYDSRVSLWHGVDPLADEAPDWTPYRYGFNNPIVYIDPDGMFETEADAKKYAKDKGIKTGWFSRTFGSGSKIAENKDGTWSIDNKKKASSTFQDKTLADDAHPDGAFTGAMVAANDVMSGTTVTEQGLFGSENMIGFNTEFRDGSTQFTPIIAGEAPDLGPGRFIKGGKKIKNLVDKMKGGKQVVRDRTFGIKDKQFWKDWEKHKQKLPGTGRDKDIKSKKIADELYEKWKNGHDF